MPAINPKPFLPRPRVVQVDAVASHGDRFAVGGKRDPADVLPRPGEGVQLLAGGDFEETEPPVARGAAGKFGQVVREREHPNGLVDLMGDRKASQFFPRGDFP